MHAYMHRLTLDRKGTEKDDFTTVALKGIIGISAMGQISAALGNVNESNTYLVNHASSIIDVTKIPNGA